MLFLELVVVFLLVIPYPSNDIRGLVVHGIKEAWRSNEFVRKVMYVVTVVNMIIFSEFLFLLLSALRNCESNPSGDRIGLSMLKTLLSFANKTPLQARARMLERFGMLACVCAHHHHRKGRARTQTRSLVKLGSVLFYFCNLKVKRKLTCTFASAPPSSQLWVVSHLRAPPPPSINVCRFIQVVASLFALLCGRSLSCPVRACRAFRFPRP
jgi:hypothetical protein